MKTKLVAMALLWAMAGPGNTPGQAQDPSVDPSKKIILMGGGHRRLDTLLRDLERMGRDNTIAVRVVDYGPWGGGIWKPVKLVAEK